MKRYAAKLLFQFRVGAGRKSGKRRICEERIVILEASSAQRALARARRRGTASEFQYENTDGNQVAFEFIGVMELLELGIECEPDEVWYDIAERVLPMENRKKLIPAESQLNAIRWEGESKKRSRRRSPRKTSHKAKQGRGRYR